MRYRILILLVVAEVVISVYILYLESEDVPDSHCSSIPAVLGLLWFAMTSFAITWGEMVFNVAGKHNVYNSN